MEFPSAPELFYEEPKVYRTENRRRNLCSPYDARDAIAEAVQQRVSCSFSKDIEEQRMIYEEAAAFLRIASGHYNKIETWYNEYYSLRSKYNAAVTLDDVSLVDPDYYAKKANFAAKTLGKHGQALKSFLDSADDYLNDLRNNL